LSFRKFLFFDVRGLAAARALEPGRLGAVVRLAVQRAERRQIVGSGSPPAPSGSAAPIVNLFEQLGGRSCSPSSPRISVIWRAPTPEISWSVL
jgi:type VI protein secretion system component VasA